jgi:hypothetical protein
VNSFYPLSDGNKTLTFDRGIESIFKVLNEAANDWEAASDGELLLKWNELPMLNGSFDPVKRSPSNASARCLQVHAVTGDRCSVLPPLLSLHLMSIHYSDDPENAFPVRAYYRSSVGTSPDVWKADSPEQFRAELKEFCQLGSTRKALIRMLAVSRSFESGELE